MKKFQYFYEQGADFKISGIESPIDKIVCYIYQNESSSLAPDWWGWKILGQIPNFKDVI